MNDIIDYHTRQFTELDYVIVRSATKSLPLNIRKVIELRFWGPNSLLEISEIMGLSYGATANLFDEGLKRLKTKCMENPLFSRAKRADELGLLERILNGKIA